MNAKKGFTLIELIAVLVVITIIFSVSVPLVSQILIGYQERLYSSQVQNIIQAARNWGAENLNLLPNSVDSTNVYAYDLTVNYIDDEYSKLTITLDDLANLGYIDSEIKNPNGNYNFCNMAKITITKTENGYEYTIDEDTLKLQGDSCK